ncbi:MAG TPA: hypothetical protein VLF20_06350 [Patescibacteria group bacterium]|nr:hypothetical protein [Patescibacteria group bacterium]
MINISMKKLSTAASGALLSLFIYASLALPAWAAPVNVNPCPTNSQFNGLCNYSANKIGSLLSSIVTILLVVAAIISLFFLIFGGIKWITSGGDKSKVESARNTIIASIIGLVVALLAFFIITIILGFFNISLTNLQLPNLTF